MDGQVKPLSTEVVVVEPRERWPKPHLRALWNHRDLAYFLSWRDVRVRYRQSLIGIGWAVLQPLASVLAFTLVFSRIGQIPSEGFPYPVFVLSGLIPWAYFSAATMASSYSLVGNIPLITKVYFPRAILPISGVTVGLLDLGIATLLLLLMMAAYGILPEATVLLLPVLVLYVLFVALGVGLWLSAFNVKYRDVQQTLPFLMQLWFFLTPVIYPGAALETASTVFQVIYALNPMVGAVELFRWAMIGTPPPPVTVFAPSIAVTLGLVLTGWIYFAKAEQDFADVI